MGRVSALVNAPWFRKTLPGIPLEPLLGRGITAEMRKDDGRGRTLDGLSAHDPTKRVAGRARRARQVCGVSTAQVHGETTSWSVRGEDAAKQALAAEEEQRATEVEADPALIARTDGSSRDPREDLTPWMLALATTHESALPLFVPPLSGTSSDTVRVVAAVQAIQEHWRATDETPRVSVADHGVCSDATMRTLHQARITGIRRVAETSIQAKQDRAKRCQTWQPTEDGSMPVDCRIREQPQGHDRWLIVRRTTSEQRAHATLARQVKRCANCSRTGTQGHTGLARSAERGGGSGGA